MEKVNVSVATRTALAATAAQRWHATYHSYKGHGPGDAERKAAIGRQLDELGPAPDPADVDRIIGNDSWTGTMCDICHRTAGWVAVCRRDDTEQDVEVCDRCTVMLYGVLKSFGPVE